MEKDPMHMLSAAVLERWNTLTDEAIVADVLEGQTALFEILMRRHNERVYRAARVILRDESEAEDVMQQAYVNAYVHLRQFSGRAQFSTWLTRIAVNEALARVRRRRAHACVGEDAMDSEPLMNSPVASDPERQAAAGELRVVLERAIDRLGDGLREVFVLREVEGMSTAEVAQALEVSEDVVKTRLSRARRAIRRDLIDRTGSSAPDVFRFYKPRCDRIVLRVLARIAGAPVK
jgi:RNA polymerase sigma-70 factor, ECF subfamily